MAISSLSLCYQNYNVFTSIVKMRKGETISVFISYKITIKSFY